MATASAGVLSISMATGAYAQALPAECTPTTTGGTIICVAPAPNEIGRIVNLVDDLTIVVGDAATPTVVNGGSEIGILSSGGGDQQVIVTPGSSVIGSFIGIFAGDLDIPLNPTRNVVIDSEGVVSGKNFGILGRSGLGSVNIIAGKISTTGPAGPTGTVGGILGIGSGDVNITATDDITTTGFGIAASVTGMGAVNIDAGTVTINSTGFDIDSGIFALISGNGDSVAPTPGTGSDITIFSSGSITGSGNGIFAQNLGIGDTAITVNEVSGTRVSGIRTLAANGTTTITLGSTALVEGNGSTGISALSTGALADITVQGMSGNVIGGTDGIDIDTLGADILVDNLASVTGNAGNGIDAASNGGNITITDVDQITGTGGNGIFANAGTGDISIQGSGLVGGITGTGPFGNLLGGGALKPGLNGSGIVALGQGSINIGGTYSIGDVTSSNAVGIFAQGFGLNDDNITISSNGLVSGNTVGIYAYSGGGAGSINITANDVSGNLGAGIRALSQNGPAGFGAGIDISVTATGTVTGGSDGVYVNNRGRGSTTIDVVDVTAGNGYGIAAIGGNFTKDFAITSSGLIDSQGIGIIAFIASSDTKPAIVTAADIKAEGDGIYATAFRSANGLAITTTGTVSAGQTGIVARNSGDGRTTITSAEVNGINGDGIRAYNGPRFFYGVFGDPSTDIIISTTGDVFGGNNGISARNFGIGETQIIATNVSATSGTGISATHGDSTTGDLTIESTGSISGGQDGVYAGNDGSGRTFITVSDVNAGGRGIYSRINGDGGVTIDSTLGSVSGGTVGIGVGDFGTGQISITTADVSATNGSAIEAFNNSGKIVISSTAGSVSGFSGGIIASGSAGRGITITTADVAGQYFSGITARSSGAILIDTRAGTVTGGFYGIDALAFGSVGDSIITTADVTASFDGIRMRGGFGDITIDSSLGTVTGQFRGIAAYNTGQQALEITANNIVGVYSDGLLARNGSAAISSAYYYSPPVIAGTDLIITTTGDVSGGLAGIDSYNNGTGATTISVHNVDGADGNGILATNGSSASDLSIVATGNVSGSESGIRVLNGGSGVTDIGLGSLAVITGGSAAAIYVRSANAISDITVQGMSGNVIGATDGIYARTGGADILVQKLDSITGNAGDGINAASGGGDIMIDSVGSITGIGGNGIYANSGMPGGDITINSVEAIFGSNGNGILAAGGTGDISIQGSGLAGGITGTGRGNLTIGGIEFFDINGSGIVAVTDGTIDVGGLSAIGDVTSSNANGIFARSNTNGSVSIVTADVTGTLRDGIILGSFGGDLTLDSSAGTVIGGLTGISARSAGAGAVSVTTSDVTGTSITGISAHSTNGGITIDSVMGTVIGGTFGILAREFGAGAVSVVAADVIGTTSIGIFAYSYGGGVALDSKAGTVTGGNFGVYVREFGAGAITITSADVTGTSFDGINAISAGGGIVLDSSAGMVTGGNTGIVATDNGAGAINLNVDDVTGGIDGISTVAAVGATTIRLSSNANVTGTTGAGIFANSTGALADITVQGMSGNVIGGTDGIDIDTLGADILVDNLASVTGNAGNGIDAASNGGNITITDVDQITGTGGNGIFANADTGNISIQGSGLVGGITGTGSGDILIGTTIFSDTNGSGIFAFTAGAIDIGGVSAIGDVTGASSFGIFSRSAAGTTVDSSAGAVTGSTGIMAGDSGGGSISITTADVTGTTGNGISTFGAGAGGVIVDSSAGKVNGGYAGISALDLGGAVSVTTADVTGTTGVGIRAQSLSGDITVDSSAGTVIGATSGILVSNNSARAAISVTTADVTGTGVYGISATSSGMRLMIDSTAGTVSGGIDGISAMNNGNGPLSVAAFSVTGNNGAGIKAINGTPSSGFRGTPSYRAPIAAGTDLTITTTGLVSAATTGVDARNYGSGSLSISTNAVTAAGTGILESGILAWNQGTELSIVSSGPIVGGYYGINSLNNGSGATNIDVTSVSATGTYGRAIQALNYSNANGLSITATGLVSGGVVTRNGGRGDLVVNVVDVDSAGTAIFAYGGVQSSNLTVSSTGVISGERQGIVATNFGSGLLAINANDVRVADGSYGEGIVAGTHGTGLSINVTGDVVGSRRGIEADNFGSGTLSIVANNVTAANGTGVDAENLSFGVPIADDLNIFTTGDVIAAFQGISARNEGLGETSLLVNNVSATGNYGSAINVFGSGTDLIIQANGSVRGGGAGINAYNRGSGSLSISTNDVTSANGNAIGATNGSAYFGGGTNLTITTDGRVSGGVAGIQVANNGTGILSITTADVTGTSGSGISAQSNGGGITVDSSAGTVTGGSFGIFAGESGAAAVRITTADVTGTSDIGISAFSNGGGILVDSSAGKVVAGRTGIFARAQGIGALSITTAGVNGTTGNGIEALSGSTSAGIRIDSSAGTVTGGLNGINVVHAGTDGVVINGATVTGGTTGVYVSHSATDSMMATVTPSSAAPAGAVMSAVESRQPAAVTADVVAVDQLSGTATSASEASFEARVVATAPNARGMIVEQMAFSGSRMDLAHLANEAQGSDDLIAEETAFAGPANPAVGAGQTSGDNAVPVREAIVEQVKVAGATPNTVGGNDNAISQADNSLGDGPASLASSAVTSSSTAEGVGISITTSGSVTGGTNGIVANNTGDRSTLINAMGDVAGTTGTGIMALGGANGNLVSITTGGTVTGGITGIWVDAGSGDLLLNIRGDVTGGDNGIVTITESGTNLTVAAGQTITGGTVGIGTMATGGSVTSNDILNILGNVNGAIMTFEGDDILTLADGSIVNGAIMLGAGADTLNFNGGGMGAIRGGDDRDTLNFNAGAGLLINSGAAVDRIAEFEVYNFNVGGFALDGTHQGLAETNFNVGDHMLLGTLASTSVNIVTGATLQTADGATISGSLNNMGDLGLNAGGIGALNINGNFSQTAGAALTMDVLNGSSDQIIVSGDVTLNGALVINQSEFVMETTTLIDGGTGLFGDFNSVAGLSSSGLLVTQALQLDRTNNDVNLRVSYASPSDVAGLTPNQIAVANNIVGQLRAGSLSGGLEDIGLGISLIGNANILGNALDELQPEIVNAGIEVLRNSQMLFVRSLLNNSAPDFGSSPVETASLAPVAMSKSSDGPNIWGSIQYTNYKQKGGLTNLNSDTDGFELATGISNIQTGPFSFGVAVGYAELDTIENGVAADRIQTDLFRLGASAAVDLNQSDKGLQAHLDTAIAAAFGSNDATMNIAIPAIGLGVQQNGKADIDSFSIFSRLTLDGIGDKAWAIKPHLLVGYNQTSQDALTLGSGATALAIQSGKFDRFTFGYGFTLEQNFNNNMALKVGVSGVHHSDDTQSSLASRFVSGAAGTQPFSTIGKNIQDQYLFETSLDHNLGDGWTASVNGYIEFGDLEGFGGLLKIGKRF
ncbi:hypothetical protein [Parasphingorhabdus sp.]|uniref:hypothetical protein n=1 Tax=Parasphingorhabdus sp. TaxID=2709688 RepID=UPI003D2B258C